MKSALSLLSPRLISCLSRLALAQDYLSVQTLADMSQSSKRTLFRELQDIDKILKPYHLNLVSKTGLGLRLLGSSEDKRHFNSILLQFKIQQNTIDKEDRQQALFAELLKNKTLQKLNYYAHQFEVSEATISIDISNIEPLLKTYHLSLIRRPGFNLWLDGEEEDFHRAIQDFIILHSQEDSFSRLISSDKTGWDIEETFKSKSGQSILAYLNPPIVATLIDIFKDKPKLLSSLNQNTISGLIIHLACVIERLSDTDYIVNPNTILDFIKQDSLYDQAKNLVETIEDEFNLIFPKIEIAYIILHLKGSRLLYIDDIEQGFHEDNAQSYDAQKLVYILIDAFERSSRLALKHDQVLIDNLITHMKGTLIRMNKGISQHNPLLKQIQSQSSDVYRQTEDAMQEVFIRHQIPLSSDEVGYYTLHFASALERLKHIEVYRKVNIAIVCASGIGISNILASRIKRLFKQDVAISIRSHQDLAKLPKEAFDLLISSIDLGLSPIPSLRVNPLLSDDDIEMIKIQVNTLARLPSKKEVNDDPAFITRLQLIEQLSQAILSIHHELDSVDIKDDLSLDQVLNIIGYRIGKDEYSGRQIVFDLKDRIKSNQVTKVNSIAFIQAKTKAIQTPIIMSFHAENEYLNAFKDDLIKALIVILYPYQMSSDLEKITQDLYTQMIQDKHMHIIIQQFNKEALSLAILDILKPLYLNSLIEINQID